VTPDEFAPLEMNKDEAERAHAAIRRLTKECIDHRHSHSSAKAISSRRRSSALNSVRFTLTPTTLVSEYQYAASLFPLHDLERMFFETA